MRGADFYGIQRIFLHYAGLPDLHVFPYAVQHGWQHAATRFEADGRPAEIWAWSQRIRRDMARYFPENRIRVVGSPYLYLPTLRDERAHGTAGGGALYVMPHSSHFTRVGLSREELRALISDIRRREGRCDVMVYYLDVTAELSTLMKSVGANMVMNGGLWSSDFLENCRKNLRCYDRLYYSAFGSAVLFAAHEGLRIEYVNLEHRLVRSENEYVNRLLEHHPLDPVGTGLSTREELGVDSMLTPFEMRRLVRKGLAHGPFFRMSKEACLTICNRARDFLRNVRRAEALIARHNA